MRQSLWEDWRAPRGDHDIDDANVTKTFEDDFDWEGAPEDGEDFGSSRVEVSKDGLFKFHGGQHNRGLHVREGKQWIRVKISRTTSEIGIRGYRTHTRIDQKIRIFQLGALHGQWLLPETRNGGLGESGQDRDQGDENDCGIHLE